MFGHDNQDNHQKDNGDGNITAPHDDQKHDDQAADAGTAPLPAPATDDSAFGGFLPSTHEPASKAPATDDLLDIKQEALQALTPLVGHLDQSPEEKFRTTMMMIQASDDHGLIKVAYEAAKQISNEKERAQALLDIVNEINYFTQHQQA